MYLILIPSEVRKIFSAETQKRSKQDNKDAFNLLYSTFLTFHFLENCEIWKWSNNNVLFCYFDKKVASDELPLQLLYKCMQKDESI